MKDAQQTAQKANTVKQVVCLAIAGLVGVYLPPAQAADLVQQEISAFQKGEYERTIELARDVLKLKPADATARYYAAEALAKLNRPAEALAQYSECEKISKDPKMTGYCRQAIATLSSRSNSKELPLPVSTSTTAASPTKMNTSEMQLLERRANIIQQGITEIEFLRKQADEKIGQIKEDAAAQLIDVPQYLYGRNRRVLNPEYSQIAERLRAESADKINDVNSEFDKRQAEITSEYKKRADACGTVQDGMVSQERAGTSQIQMTPQNSNAYVRNFVNYDGYKPPPPPVPLRAGEAKLLPKASSQPKSGAGSSGHDK